MEGTPKSLLETLKIAGNSTGGRCDYFKIRGHKKEYFVVTEFYFLLFLPLFRIRQYIAKKTDDSYCSRTEVCVVLTEEHRASVILAYLNSFVVVGSIISFIVALTTSILTEVWWRYIVVWSIFLTFTWCLILFVGFYKHPATKKNAAKYTRLVINNMQTGETENVQVQLDSGTNNQVQTEAKQPFYSYDQPTDQDPPPSVHHI